MFCAFEAPANAIIAVANAANTTLFITRSLSLLQIAGISNKLTMEDRQGSGLHKLAMFANSGKRYLAP
jgi:hypothetical protein